MQTMKWGSLLLRCFLISGIVFSALCHDIRNIGCFNDGRRRILQNQLFHGNLTIEICADHCCSSPNMTYMGVESNDECYCGNQPNNSTFVPADPSLCWFSCAGNANQICGGYWKINIYEILECKKDEQLATTSGCACPCKEGNRIWNITETDFLTKLIELRKAIKVNRKSTTTYKNSKISAPDNRISSRNLGIFGAIIITSPIILFITIDFINLVKYTQTKRT